MIAVQNLAEFFQIGSAENCAGKTTQDSVRQSSVRKGFPDAGEHQQDDGCGYQEILPRQLRRGANALVCSGAIRFSGDEKSDCGELWRMGQGRGCSQQRAENQAATCAGCNRSSGRSTIDNYRWAAGTGREQSRRDSAG